jgi:hypothetical protein
MKTNQLPEATMTLKPGDKVKTCYGHIETVLIVEESRIVTEQSGLNSWYHPTKVTKVEKRKSA